MPIDLGIDLGSKAPTSLDPARIARHAAVLAQSGSGKSFMLGRLIEELLIKTKARVLVFDPNSDFIRLRTPDQAVFSTPKLSNWFFPGESFRQFEKDWGALKFAIASNHNLEGGRPIAIDWGRLSESEMASVMNLESINESDLYWCLFLTCQLARDTWDNEDETFDFDHFREQSEKVVNYLLSNRGSQLLRQNPLAQTLRKSVSKQTALRFRALVASLAEFSIWRSTGDGEKDICTWAGASEEESRVLVVDLQSLQSELERTTVVNRLLSSMWDKARRDMWEATRDYEKPDLRVPTFIIIDEAHNLIPAIKTNAGMERLGAQLVRVAAEGRKFGLYLIVATQRPRKVDSNVLSECDNLFLMKMTNDSDLHYAQEIFGFLDEDLAKKASTLTVGEMILAGSIAVTKEVVHSSPRRTVQGGRGISETHWATP